MQTQETDNGNVAHHVNARLCESFRASMTYAELKIKNCLVVNRPTDFIKTAQFDVNFPTGYFGGNLQTN
jgi:hypothetical protein